MRFFEEWTVERIRLVEDGQRVEHAVMKHALDRVFPAGNEALDKNRVVRLIALGAHVER